MIKSEDLKHYKLSGSIILAISIAILMVNHHLENLIGQGQEEEKQKNAINDVNFGSPQNNTFNLGRPFLVQFDNTTSLKPIGKATLDNFELTFAGYGIINETIRYNDNGTGIFITNPDDGTVYQKGGIELRTESGNDSIKTTYESLGSDSQSADRDVLLDNGVMFFNVSSTAGGETVISQ